VTVGGGGGGGRSYGTSKRVRKQTAEKGAKDW